MSTDLRARYHLVKMELRRYFRVRVLRHNLPSCRGVDMVLPALDWKQLGKRFNPLSRLDSEIH